MGVRVNKIEIDFSDDNASLYENYDILIKILGSISGFDEHFLYVYDNKIVLQFR